MGAHHRQRSRLLQQLTDLVHTGINRRRFLQGAGAGVGAVATGAALGGCGSSSQGASASLDGGGGTQPGGFTPPSAPAPGSFEFQHGVASGDPLADRVVLWTRITPGEDAGAISVDYVVDTALATVQDDAFTATGAFLTSAFRDYTVKVDPANLAAGTTYYYRFRVMDSAGNAILSPIGRTKTAGGAGTDRARFAVVACSNYSFGFFNGFGAIARRADLDAIIHLGDYLYETAANNTRAHFPAVEIVTLEEYRLRFAQYRTDPDLAEAHRQHPMIAIWDDHETTNNSYRDGADNHQADAEGDWFERKGRAVRAYFEWMPIRDNVSIDTAANFDAPAGAAGMDGLLPEGNGSIQRSFAYGDLIDLVMLDTRLAGRAIQNGTDTVSEQQTILGEAQRTWFLDALTTSNARWKIVGQQMTFAPIFITPPTPAADPTYLNSDAWDGYRFDRNAVFETIATNSIDNVVVLSGDTHVITAFDLTQTPFDPAAYNPATGDGAMGVEFSSNGIANVGIINEAQVANNPHLKFANVSLQGYLLLDVDEARAQGEYYVTGAPTAQDPTETLLRVLPAGHEDNRLTLTAATVPSPEREDAAPLAP